MNSIAVKVGNVTIGGNTPIKVQTMCNTHTQDVTPSVEQCIEMVNAGAEIIRLTTQGMKEVEALAIIKKELRAQGYDVPLVADVHFNSDVAIEVAKVAEKVRINPGNFAKDHTVAKSHFKGVIEVCRVHNSAGTIGLNRGAL